MLLKCRMDLSNYPGMSNVLKTQKTVSQHFTVWYCMVIGKKAQHEFRETA